MSSGPRAITSVAVALLLAHALNLALMGAQGPGRLISDALLLAAVLLAVWSCFAGARRHAGLARHLFTLVGAGFTLWALGEATLLYLRLRRLPNPSPSLSDVFFFAYFIPLAAALVLHREPSKQRVNWILTLDLAQVGILIATVYLNFVFYLPSLMTSGLQMPGSEASVYSVFDVLLLGGSLLRTVLSGRGIVRSLYARLTAVLGIYAAASGLCTYAITVWRGPLLGLWFDLGYSLPFLLAAVILVAWKPAAQTTSPPPQFRQREALVQALPMLGPVLVLLLAMHELSTNFLTAVTVIVASFVCYTARLWLTQAALRSSEAQFRALAESSRPASSSSRTTTSFTPIPPPKPSAVTARKNCLP
jgi:hypothetical protein